MLSLGCPKSEPAQKAPPVETKAKPSQVTKAPEAAAPSDPECIGAFVADGTPTKLDINQRSYELRGSRLVETSTDQDDEIVIGVVADIKEDTPENIKNLKAILDFFKAEKAELIVVDGDLGENEPQIANVLEVLVQSGLPTFPIIGNREKKADFNNAVKTVQSKHNNIFNLNFVRLVQLDDVSLVSMPGYFNKDYIHVENGCHYLPSDVEGLRPIVKAAGEKPIVLVSHGPPKQDGPEALDRTLEQANVGDPAMARFLQESGVKLGIFANIHEAGGRATDLLGANLVAPGKMSTEMYMSPGPADSVRWTMNDRTESVGMAAVMIVKGKQASYKSFRIKPAE
jgi:Icc-related predicted phosphoesterase